MTTFYDQVYGGHLQGSAFGLPEQHLADFLAGHPFREKYACDVGCGDGRQSIYLASNGWHVLAVDNSSRALSRLESERQMLCLDKNIDVRCADISTLKLEETTFSLVLCVNTLHEIGQSATKHLLTEIKLSAPNGVVYLAFFVPCHGTYIKKKCYYPSEADIIKEFAEWEIVAQDKLLFEHEHITPTSKSQPQIHRHMQAHLFFQKHTHP